MGIPRPQTSFKPPWPHEQLAVALRRKNAKQIAVAMRRVHHAAQDMTLRQTMESGGVAATIVTLLSHPAAGCVARCRAMHAVEDFAVTSSAQFIAAGIVSALIPALRATRQAEFDAIWHACRALRLFLTGDVSSDAAEEALQLGVVPALIDLIKVGGHGSITAALPLLAALAGHGTRFQSAIVRYDGLYVMNEAACRAIGQCPETILRALHGLADFAGFASWRECVVKAGGLETAVRALLYQEEPQVAAEAGRLIANVCCTPHGRRSCVKAGAGPALVRRLGCGERGTSPILCQALVRLFREPRAANSALLNGPAVGTLLWVCVRAVSKRVGRMATLALRVLAGGSSSRRAKVLFAVRYQLRMATGPLAARLFKIRKAILLTPVTPQSAIAG